MATRSTKWVSLFEKEEKEEKAAVLKNDTPVPLTERAGRCPKCGHGRFSLKLLTGSKIGRTCDRESGGCGYELEAID
jgi:uncharacterized protein (DUF983 family)